MHIGVLVDFAGGDTLVDFCRAQTLYRLHVLLRLFHTLDNNSKDCPHMKKGASFKN